MTYTHIHTEFGITCLNYKSRKKLPQRPSDTPSIETASTRHCEIGRGLRDATEFRCPQGTKETRDGCSLVCNKK